MFAYCGNNPVSRKDNGGEFWETVIDVVSLCASVAEVMANPSDPWAWAGLVGDAVDLLPFVTGVGEVTKAAKISINAIQSSDNVVQAARRLYNAAGNASGLRKATGSYEILFESGRNYVGKGGFYRSTVSASFRSKLNNDRVLAITWTPAQSTADAYIAEYFLMKVNGVKNDNTYNAIWSPGKKLMESVWKSVFGG